MQPGMTHSLAITVEPSMTASNMKSGCLDVFATPILVAFLENVCLECVQDSLEPGMTTVGTAVNVSHLAPTPVGMTVRFECTLREIDRRRLVFDVRACDEVSLVAEGTHERFVVDAEKFVQKCLCRGKS